MGKKASKLVALLLSLMIAVSVLAGCAEKGGKDQNATVGTETQETAAVTTETEPEDEFVTLKIIYPGSPSKKSIIMMKLFLF